jgi:hypothetical protein
MGIVATKTLPPASTFHMHLKFPPSPPVWNESSILLTQE